jgi:hypothetical protein
MLKQRFLQFGLAVIAASIPVVIIPLVWWGASRLWGTASSARVAAELKFSDVFDGKSNFAITGTLLRERVLVSLQPGRKTSAASSRISDIVAVGNYIVAAVPGRIYVIDSNTGKLTREFGDTEAEAESLFLPKSVDAPQTNQVWIYNVASVATSKAAICGHSKTGH